MLDANNNVLETSYYRYYVAGEANGYTHGLKYVFTPDSYDRLTAALGSNVSNLTDGQVAPYADNYFQYDSSQHVTLETAAGAGDSQSGGGLGTYTFSYASHANAPGTDSWAVKTVVGNPDGSTDTVYTNYLMEVMLADHYDPAAALHSDYFYAYNDLGQNKKRGHSSFPENEKGSGVDQTQCLIGSQPLFFEPQENGNWARFVHPAAGARGQGWALPGTTATVSKRLILSARPCQHRQQTAVPAIVTPSANGSPQRASAGEGI